ncbi:hypothetical protein TrVE_jg6819 [Triparma verrucosa]|uniref:Cyclin-like domain-containing protein n=1 Tax=Triparma verrucosa TaxID=1606542 RepID=A0A9W7BHN4_9STRA|nr:hypothetical protein TrVE_jg6819 [Triparma verrucosa]
MASAYASMNGSSILDDNVPLSDPWITRKSRRPPPPSVVTGHLTSRQELRTRRNTVTFILQLGEALCLPRQTVSTSIIFFHRFFSRQSFATHSRYDVSVACTFLASKVDETPRKVASVVLQSHMLLERINNSTSSVITSEAAPATLDLKSEEFLELKDRILILERVVLQTLSFDLTVSHAYKPFCDLMSLLKSKYTSGGFVTKGGENVGQQVLAQIGVGVMNDSYGGRVWLGLRGEEIAKCAVMAAVVVKEVEVKGGGSWLEVLDLEREVWEEFVEEFNEMAECGVEEEGEEGGGKEGNL